LTNMGYKNVKRYAGGIEDWQKAGYTLEGNVVS
jgi:rhodanese-related sulfurtransferase